MNPFKMMISACPTSEMLTFSTVSLFLSKICSLVSNTNIIHSGKVFIYLLKKPICLYFNKKNNKHKKKKKILRIWFLQYVLYNIDQRLTINFLDFMCVQKKVILLEKAQLLEINLEVSHFEGMNFEIQRGSSMLVVKKH